MRKKINCIETIWDYQQKVFLLKVKFEVKNISYRETHPWYKQKRKIKHVNVQWPPPSYANDIFKQRDRDAEFHVGSTLETIQVWKEFFKNNKSQCNYITVWLLSLFFTHMKCVLILLFLRHNFKCSFVLLLKYRVSY